MNMESNSAAPGIGTVSILEIVAKYVGRTSSAYRYIAEDLRQIDARPKEGITVVTDAMVNAALRVQYARAGSVWTGTEANPDFVDMRHILNAALQATSAEAQQ